MTYQLTYTEEERQMLVLALAQLGIERPGWEPALILPVVERLDPNGTMYRDLQQLSREKSELGKVLARQLDHVLMRCEEATVDGEHCLRPELIHAIGAVREALAGATEPDCPGCTDPRSEGTHSVGTKQHPGIRSI